MNSHPLASVFFPQDILDLLVDSGSVELDADAFLVTRAGGRYQLTEAARVLREITTGEDPLGLVGSVRTKTYITEELGGELLGGSLLVNENGYDVVPGMLGAAVDDSGSADHAQTEYEVLEALQEMARDVGFD